MNGKRVLLVVSGGIAAYKSLELIRLIRKAGGAARCILTAGGAEFVTPLSLASLSEDKVYQDLFSLTDENEMGHIRLTREADLVVVAPASADIIAKMAHGEANDLATTALLATDKPVLIAPAMNHRMWHHAATRENLKTLAARGIHRIGPTEGDMACGEFGMGRMAEPEDIFAAIRSFFDNAGRLVGRHALVTSGPTHEPIDPVRYIANRSSGRQGHAIAEALAAMGARTTLVTGPVALADPAGVAVHHVESAADMLRACEGALPADVAVCAAAVADWRPAEAAAAKIKKNGAPPSLSFAENPDILKTLSEAGNRRPALVIGFAAETGDTVELAGAKRTAKGCDWIVANDVSAASGVFGGAENKVHVIDQAGVEDWPKMAKTEVASRLAARIALHFEALA